MAVLSTGDITLPKNIAAGLFAKAVTGSAISVLSGQVPMQFGDVSFMTFETPPRAEYVGEGSPKGHSTPGFGVRTAKPHKAHVTMRFNEEVKWADEDYQLGVLTTVADAGAVALARALDLGAFHGINPLTGAAVSSIVAADRIGTTSNRVESSSVSEVQTVTITGGPTGGSFTLTFNGQATGAIAFNATGATVQTALRALSNLNDTGVSVTGSGGGPYTVTFAAALGNVAQMTAASSLTGGTTPGVTVATTTEGVSAATTDLEFESAAGLIVADGYIPTGTAFDPRYAWSLSTSRYTDGRKKFPELGLGLNLTTFEGLRASTSSTVSGQPEATDTKLRAIVGQWDLLRWGVQRRVPVEMIEFGDPDGQGDLKRNNQIALRLEVVYGWVVMDLDGFAVIEDAA